MAAALLPGKVLHVALAITRAAHREQANPLVLRRSLLAQVGTSRDAGYPALQHLEAAGLLSVERRLGAEPVVTLLPAAG